MDIFSRLIGVLRYRFNLKNDGADEETVIATIKKDVPFQGVNLWTLIFAIFIASIGLNVNSTAVIIGAMLISPIMGPVMGIGLGIAINDLKLVKRGAKNLLVATVISIATSSVYFVISPLHTVQSELLARTSPSIWDVFIAFFGGMAGMVAASRKVRTNVIPGVAIATALMPPLCTAGFGIATGRWDFFFGAIYLYFINSIFISIATYLISRYLGLHNRYYEDPTIERKVRRYVWVIAIVMIGPSVYFGWRIVDKSIFERNARRFVEEQFNFTRTQVVSQNYRYAQKDKAIDLLLIGRELDTAAIGKLTRNLRNYKLDNVRLNIRQGLNARQEIDFAQIRASILDEVFQNNARSDSLIRIGTETAADSSILEELTALYPSVRSFGTSDMVLRRTDTLRTDTVKLAFAQFNPVPTDAEMRRMEAWLKVKLKSPKLRFIAR